MSFNAQESYARDLRLDRQELAVAAILLLDEAVQNGVFEIVVTP